MNTDTQHTNTHTDTACIKLAIVECIIDILYVYVVNIEFVYIIIPILSPHLLPPPLPSPALLFTMAGFFQMAVWALAKHKNYKKEFEKYPRRRRAILPFLL